jgi:hypothetical protein
MADLKKDSIVDHEFKTVILAIVIVLSATIGYLLFKSSPETFGIASTCVTALLTIGMSYSIFLQAGRFTPKTRPHEK